MTAKEPSPKVHKPSRPAPARDRAGTRLRPIARLPKARPRKSTPTFSPGDLCYLLGPATVLPQALGRPIPATVSIGRMRNLAVPGDDPRWADQVIFHPWTSSFPCTVMASVNGWVLLQWSDRRLGLCWGWVDAAAEARVGVLNSVVEGTSVPVTARAALGFRLRQRDR